MFPQVQITNLASGRDFNVHVYFFFPLKFKFLAYSKKNAILLLYASDELGQAQSVYGGVGEAMRQAISSITFAFLVSCKAV